MKDQFMFLRNKNIKMEVPHKKNPYDECRKWLGGKSSSGSSNESKTSYATVIRKRGKFDDIDDQTMRAPNLVAPSISGSSSRYHRRDPVGSSSSSVKSKSPEREKPCENGLNRTPSHSSQESVISARLREVLDRNSVHIYGVKVSHAEVERYIKELDLDNVSQREKDEMKKTIMTNLSKEQRCRTLDMEDFSLEKILALERAIRVKGDAERTVGIYSTIFGAAVTVAERMFEDRGIRAEGMAKKYHDYLSKRRGDIADFFVDYNGGACENSGEEKKDHIPAGFKQVVAYIVLSTITTVVKGDSLVGMEMADRLNDICESSGEGGMNGTNSVMSMISLASKLFSKSNSDSNGGGSKDDQYNF